ncbi:unnamed protein product [Lampetra planeri]
MPLWRRRPTWWWLLLLLAPTALLLGSRLRAGTRRAEAETRALRLQHDALSAQLQGERGGARDGGGGHVRGKAAVTELRGSLLRANSPKSLGRVESRPLSLVTAVGRGAASRAVLVWAQRAGDVLGLTPHRAPRVGDVRGLVYEHRSRLEKSLQKERQSHRRTKDDYSAFKVASREQMEAQKSQGGEMEREMAERSGRWERDGAERSRELRLLRQQLEEAERERDTEVTSLQAQDGCKRMSVDATLAHLSSRNSP